MTTRSTLRTLAAGTPDRHARELIVRAHRVLDGLLDEVRRDLAPRAGRAEVSMKSDGTPVTPYDRATDEWLTTRLVAAFPGHGTISEEAGHVAPATDWTWVLDPIDGTSNFIAGVPYWCVSVALCLEGAPVLGVVEAPPLGLRFSASAGAGAEVRSEGAVRRIRVAAPAALHAPASSHVPGLYSGGAARDLTADGVTLNARLMGAAALDLAMVANGVAPLAVTLGPHVWDVAAGGLLVIEAGGAVVGAGESPLLPLVVGRDYGRAVERTAAATDEATARAAHEAVVRGRTSRHRS
jgi:myo-inositol-1(or 4)-monophosphatase